MLYRLTQMDAKLDQILAGSGGGGATASLPVGTVQAFLSGHAPAGWLALDGGLADKTAQAELYALIGDAYAQAIDIDALRAAAANSVPVMTSDTAPSGVVSASGAGSGYEAWKAFDASNVSCWEATPGTEIGSWLQYDYGAGVAKFPVGYRLTNYSNLSDQCPSAWTIQASQDGVAWTDLDARSGVYWGWLQAQRFDLPETKVGAAWRMFRILCTARGFGTSYVAINRLELLTVDSMAPYQYAAPGDGQFRLPNFAHRDVPALGMGWYVKAAV